MISIFDIKQVNVEIFKAIRDDAEIVKLLDIDKFEMTHDEFIAALRKQIFDAQTPDDLLTNYSTKICIHDESGGSVNSFEEVGYIAVDIHITQDKTSVDRRHLIIMKRLIEILDTNNRQKLGLKKLPIGLYGLSYRRRDNIQLSRNTGWEKYTLVFEYKYLI